MSSLRLLGNIFVLEILLGERSGTFRDYDHCKGSRYEVVEGPHLTLPLGLALTMHDREAWEGQWEEGNGRKGGWK